MGNLSEIIAVACDDCGGAGFIFYGNENDFDVETCDCVADVEDELTLQGIKTMTLMEWAQYLKKSCKESADRKKVKLWLV